MSDFVLDASLTLQWFLEDETDRNYSLEILQSLSDKQAMVPILWFYEVGNGLLMAIRRKRISVEQMNIFLARLGHCRLLRSRIQRGGCAAFRCALALSYGLTNLIARRIYPYRSDSISPWQRLTSASTRQLPHTPRLTGYCSSAIDFAGPQSCSN